MTEAISNAATRGRRFRRLARNALLLYLTICLLMTFLESSLVYPRPHRSAPEYWELNHELQDDVFFEAGDGIRLHGWFFAHEAPQFAILYCHGNGEDISSNAEYMNFLRSELQASVFVFDYRGYGKSAGSPDEAGLILDGLAAQSWLAEKMQMQTSEVVIMGRSLGGGVAVAAAEQQGARALVLQNTFANLADVAASKFFWLPVRWIMQNRYPSAERIKSYHGPILQTHGTADQVVPYAEGQKLFDAAPGRHKQWIANNGLGHNEPFPSSYYDSLAEFLGALPD